MFAASASDLQRRWVRLREETVEAKVTANTVDAKVVAIRATNLQRWWVRLWEETVGAMVVAISATNLQRWWVT